MAIVVLTDCGHRGASLPRDAVASVAAALTRGHTLKAKGHVVGPIGDGLFACTDRSLTPLVELEVEHVTIPFFAPGTGKPNPWFSGTRVEERRDFTAFGAARCFVRAVGERVAFAACERANKASGSGENISSVQRPLAGGGISEEPAASRQAAPQRAVTVHSAAQTAVRRVIDNTSAGGPAREKSGPIYCGSPKKGAEAHNLARSGAEPEPATNSPLLAAIAALCNGCVPSDLHASLVALAVVCAGVSVGGWLWLRTQWERR